MSAIKTIITHYPDACRYVTCGWTITAIKTVELNGKSYQETTIVWDDANGETPVYPTGEAPPLFAD